MNQTNEFTLPIFDRPMELTPSDMTYKQVVAEFEKIIQTLRFREEPRDTDEIPEFTM